MKRRFSLIATVVLTVAAASSLSAQTVRGTVVDSATVQPLASVSVELTDSAAQVVVRASTDEAGNYLLRAPAPGAYRLRVQRIGYRQFESPMVLNARGDLTLPLRLSAVPVQLAAVRVEAARSVYLQDHGFYRRRESERGTFLDPAAIDKRIDKAKLATDILIGIPGVTIYQGAPKLRGCRTLLPNKGDIPGMARIYVNGVESGTEMMWSLQPRDILAVEVYIGPAQIPLQYGGTNNPCGIILIWTKH